MAIIEAEIDPFDNTSIFFLFFFFLLKFENREANDIIYMRLLKKKTKKSTSI